MTGADVLDPGAVGAATAGWLAGRLGTDVRLAEPPTRAGGGQDTTIHLVRFAGDGLPDEWARPLVVRIHPSPGRLDRARREAAIQAFCADHGYPCPRVLVTLAPGELLPLPVQVVERVPGVTMLAAVTGRPWSVGRLLDTLGRLHARLHALPLDGFPVTGEGARHQARGRLNLPRDVVADRGAHVPGLAAALGRVEALLPRLDRDELAVCHNDYHPLNVLVDGAEAHVVDWTDAGPGDPHGDVARLLVLLRAAAAGAPRAPGRALLRMAEPWVVRRYLRAYRREAPAPLDAERLALWEPVQLVHDWARAALIAGMGEDPPGDRAGPTGPAGAGSGPAGSSGDGAADGIDRRVGERVVAWCRARYGEAISAADGHPPPAA